MDRIYNHLLNENIKESRNSNKKQNWAVNCERLQKSHPEW